MVGSYRRVFVSFHLIVFILSPCVLRWNLELEGSTGGRGVKTVDREKLAKRWPTRAAYIGVAKIKLGNGNIDRPRKFSRNFIFFRFICLAWHCLVTNSSFFFYCSFEESVTLLRRWLCATTPPLRLPERVSALKVDIYVVGRGKGLSWTYARGRRKKIRTQVNTAWRGG